MFRKTSVNSEEFIFYIDLTTDFLKKKSLSKSISSFIKDKEKFNTLSSYGILLFQEDDNPITVYDAKDFGALSDVIDEKWQTRETEKSLFENGLFEILAYIFRKSREARKNYRVIIISDTPSLLSEDYHHALYDVKLKVVASETHGGVFYCTEAKLFLNILRSLIQSKSEFIVVQPKEDDDIFEEDKIFYERLAVDLISLDSEEEEKCDICERELCPICDAHSDEVHKCFNCNAKYHACCAANYAIANPIGFNHLFRCIQCDTLLKLDEEYVEMIYREEHEEEFEAELMELGITDEIIEEELFGEEQIEEQSFEEDEELVIGKEIIGPEKLRPPPRLVKPPPNLTPTKKVKVGGYFGEEINIINNDLVPTAIKTIVSDSEGTIQVKEKISITSLKPPRKSTIKFCQMCGQTLSGTSICPICGFKN